MKKTLLSLAIAAAAVMPNVASAQGSGAGCSGNLFLFCASWSWTTVGNDLTLVVNNTSASNAISNNANSSFTKIAIGNLLSSPVAVSVTKTSGSGTWGALQKDPGNQFNGFNLSDVWYGSYTSGINDGLKAGESVTLKFTFDGSVQNNAIDNNMSIAIHDQGGIDPNTRASCSTKGVLDGDTGDNLTTGYTPLSNGDCSPSEVPEPASFGLVFAGLAGLAGMTALRRRQA